MQIYHSNAKTNSHIRTEIKHSSLSISKLAIKYGISNSTVLKWKKRTSLEDRSARPKTIHYTLTDFEQSLFVALRKSTWLPLDALTQMVFGSQSTTFRSAVYRTLKRNDVNRVPKEQKEKAKKFKDYPPGYLHIDVTYLPKIEGKRTYLFVAIDRATRMVFYKFYEAKTSTNAEHFVQKCIDFYPFKITHILTDNGLEFTNHLRKKGLETRIPSKVDNVCKLHNIKHRLTRPFTPKTNGMVEKANDIIKSNTVKFRTYQSLSEMDKHLTQFFINYNMYRRHGSLVKELKVNTPFEALQKWYEFDSEIFHRTPLQQRAIIYSINSIFIKQRCET